MLASNLPAPPTPVSSPSPAEVWAGLVAPYAEFLDEVSSELARQIDSFEPEIAEHASYVISNPGKRLRPLLVGLAGGAHEGYGKSLVEVAVVIEMVHLATLVHDDILDAAEIRRNRPTLASRLGNDVTVLLGDCLFAHALRLAASFPTTEVCAAVAQATKRVCSGEILQTLNQAKHHTQAHYLKVIEMKTAELFALSCDLGAAFGSAMDSERRSLRQYGLSLGTAYQIFDDCLDIFGDEAHTGKSLGTDLMKEKKTLPVLLLLEKSNPDEKKQIISKLNDWDRCHIPWLMKRMASQHILEQSQCFIRDVLESSRRCLDAMEGSRVAAPLYKLSQFLELKVDEMAPNIPPGTDPT